ncbi:MAG: hypothetical protein L0Z48_00845 [candidate division Zixibacteria bacterium]|nr:hypothetical protein [candidate division Zixibacteria bacterium]MCI0595070.1 hypothetical protein [candidate division Zixibacteria bacterium]
MRMLWALVFMAAAVSPVWGQEYFPLNPGTRKHFQATVNQNTSVGGQSAMSVTAYFRNTEEVIGQAKVYEKPAILVRTTRVDSIPGRPADDSKLSQLIENYYQARPQGIFLLANFNLPADTGQKPDSTRYEPTLQVLKLPADSGAKWIIGTMKMQGILVGLTGQVLGREDVETPGGSFKNCLKTKSGSTSVSGGIQGASGLAMNVTGGEFSSTSWYAPGVGLVKQDVATRFVLSSPNLPPGMSAELSFQQNLALTKVETAPKEEKKATTK